MGLAVQVVVMADSRSSPAEDEPDEESTDSTEPPTEPAATDEAELTTEELRRQVEEQYDFENFGPQDMAEMSAEEWDAVFDPETWITGAELLDRVEADLSNRIATREVFARLERFGDPDRLVAYSDEGYAVVYADGSVEGMGTVRRDVEPTVALCSMDDYEVADPPDDEALPSPMEVPEGSGELGNLMLQVIAAAQLLAGLGLLAAWLLEGLGVIPLVIGLAFLTFGIVLFLVVANARLSDRFRAEEYRNRLRAVGVDSDEVPEFLAQAHADGELPAALEALVEGETDDDPSG
jgi:hypothetical protein